MMSWKRHVDHHGRWVQKKGGCIVNAVCVDLEDTCADVAVAMPQKQIDKEHCLCLSPGFFAAAVQPLCPSLCSDAMVVTSSV